MLVMVKERERAVMQVVVVVVMTAGNESYREGAVHSDSLI